MKKLVYFIAAGAFLASCNRNEAVNNGEPLSSNLNTQHFEKAELDGMITPMAQSFGFTGKASDIGTAT